MTTLQFILACYGMTIIVTRGKIFEWLRNGLLKHAYYLGYLFKCPMCFSFWVGVALSATGCYDLNPFLSGIMATGAVWPLFVALEWLGQDEL